MPAADRRFFGRAWASLASTRNVFGKLCLIALLQFVPILGQIVALGYFLGWVREAAWGMETPAPAHVLSGGDRAFWPRGAKAWVTTLLYGLIEAAFICILGAVWTFFGHMQGGIVDDIVLGVLVAAGLCGTILLTICCYVGLVRLAVYNRFGAAWQWGKSLQMAGRDFGGLLKLFFGTVGLNVHSWEPCTRSWCWALRRALPCPFCLIWPMSRRRASRASSPGLWASPGCSS